MTTQQPQPGAKRPKTNNMKTGIELIAEERQRQIEKEGWTPEHDDQHRSGELAQAASCYALPGELRFFYVPDAPENWPWAADWWKPSNYEFDTDDNYVEERIKELKKAGALIAAEIDRLHRLTQPSHRQAQRG